MTKTYKSVSEYALNKTIEANEALRELEKQMKLTKIPIKLPTHNFTMDNPNFSMELEGGGLTFSLFVKKNWKNRLKFWLFTKFFPFNVTFWEKEKEEKKC